MPYPIPYAPRTEEDKNKIETAHEAVANGENMRNGDIEDDVVSFQLEPVWLTNRRDQ